MNITKASMAPLRLCAALLVFTLCQAPPLLAAGELARGVRLKVSAGDLLSAEAMVEDYRQKTGTDLEYLNGLAWLARGALLLGETDRASSWAQQVRRAIASPVPADQLTALGAAIEVEAKIKARQESPSAAVAFLEKERQWSDDPAFQSRLSKNVNLLTLVGAPAPEIVAGDQLGLPFSGLANLAGRPIVLFFWANWCGDCKDQAATLARIKTEFEKRGVAFVAVTRFYGTGADNAEVPPAEEKKQVAAVLASHYGELGELSVVFSTPAMIRYGASATPTFVFVDARGRVAGYTPTRLTEAELRRRIEPLLTR